MKLRGDFVNIVCQLNTEYKQHVIYDNGKNLLYLLVIMVIYGCIESALLWYNLLSTTLEGVCFEINPYERCVANKTIEFMKCTINWYVDDNKLSHKNPEVILNIIK